jgi:hypothetical protein
MGHIEADLTPGGLISEVTDVLQTSRTSRGEGIEKLVSSVRLNWIAGDRQQIDFGAESDKARQGVDIFIRGLLEDYDSVVSSYPGIDRSVKNFAKTNVTGITRELKETIKEYGNLRFSEDDDIRKIVKDDHEMELLKEGAQLLGYQIDVTSDATKFKLNPRHNLKCDVETAIRIRIKVGLNNLIVDFDDAEPIRRPIRRTLVAMADHMAKQFRSQNPNQSSGK